MSHDVVGQYLSNQINFKWLLCLCSLKYIFTLISFNQIRNQNRQTPIDFGLSGNVVKHNQTSGTKEWSASAGLTLPLQHWPELPPEGPLGPTPSASGFHAGQRRTWTCVPAKKGETLLGNSSDAKTTEGTDPGEGSFPLWVETHLVEEHNTQYCKHEGCYRRQ